MQPFQILVVDDFEPFRQFICSILKQKYGFQLGEACDGLEAIEKAEQLQPDLILLDVGLPKLNGIQAAKKLRYLAPHTQIVFLSVESSPDMVQEALKSGAAGYIQKLNIEKELVPTIETLRGDRFVGKHPESEFSKVTTAQPVVRVSKRQISVGEGWKFFRQHLLRTLCRSRR